METYEWEFQNHRFKAEDEDLKVFLDGDWQGLHIYRSLIPYGACHELYRLAARVQELESEVSVVRMAGNARVEGVTDRANAKIFALEEENRGLRDDIDKLKGPIQEEFQRRGDERDLLLQENARLERRIQELEAPSVVTNRLDFAVIDDPVLEEEPDPAAVEAAWKRARELTEQAAERLLTKPSEPLPWTPESLIERLKP